MRQKSRYIAIFAAMKFVKYQGTGNDFVVVDNRSDWFPKSDLDLVRKLCDRKFGIGSDGLILLNNSSEFDFDMGFYNPDGSTSFCGNGSRCIIHYAHFLGLFTENCTFSAIDGIHHGKFGEKAIQVSMANVDGIEVADNWKLIDTGSPHVLIPSEDVLEADLMAQAHAIRYNDRFREKGVNVNLVQIRGDHHIRMRTYERGVENETLSCGTGVTAAALSVASVGKQLIEVETQGGTLSVRCVQNAPGIFTDIWLTGPVEQVYSGEIGID